MTVNSSAITDASDVVNTGADLIYYQSGQSSDYSESTDSSEQHTAAETAQVKVVTITESGTYEISGSLKNGQLAVDLSENAVSDPNAVVTLILNGCDISNNIKPRRQRHQSRSSGNPDPFCQIDL